MFFSRPDIPPLNIDLVEVNAEPGNGANYTGRTSDGRPVRLHYRYGTIWVWLAAVGDDVPSRADDHTYEYLIGSRWHGDMSLAQFCDLLGITVRGKKGPFDDPLLDYVREPERLFDYSGMLSYFEVTVFAFTPSVQAFLGLLQRELKASAPYVFKFSDRGERTRFEFTSSSDVEHGYFLDIHAGEHGIRLGYNGRQNMLSGDNMDKACSEILGRNIQSTRLMESELLMQWRSDDIVARAEVDMVLGLFKSQHFCEVEIIDLLRRTSVESVRTEEIWYSNDLIAWCAADQDRYLSCYNLANDEGEQTVYACLPSALKNR